MPTSAHEIARMVTALLARPDLGGVFHLTHEGEPQSWWSCGSTALEIAHDLGLIPERVEVAARRLAEIGQLAAPRPVHTAMAPRRLREEVGWPVMHWEEAARACLQQRFG